MRAALFLLPAALCIAVMALLYPSHIREMVFTRPLPGVLPLAQEKAVVLFGGDLFFDRTVREVAQQKGDDYLFSCLDPLLEHSDLFVANLEGPITTNDSYSVGTDVGSYFNFVFTFPTSTAALLARHRVSIVDLGNNHIENFGVSGEAQTKEFLTGSGVDYFGDPHGMRMATTSVHGVSLAFVSYNEFGGSSSTTLAQIGQARRAGYMPVVFAHWGTEYVAEPPEANVALAHAFVDAGAVLVVGSHPHVVGLSEYYKGVPIYYSLGNLIFDQYFSSAVRHGLMLRVVFGKLGVLHVDTIPVVLGHDRRTCPEAAH